MNSNTEKEKFKKSAYYDHDFEKSVKKVEEILRQNVKDQDKKGESESLINLGELYFEHNDYKLAEKKYIKALKIIRKEKFKLKEPRLLTHLGLLKIEEYDFTTALNYFLDALKLTSKKNIKVLSTLYHSIGYSYGFLEMYKESMNYLKKALKVRKELNFSKGVSQTLNRIGLNYYYQCDYKEAIKYLKDSYELRKENRESKKSISSSLNNIMVVYHKIGEYKQALETGHEALNIFEVLKMRHESSFVLNNLGLVYYDMALYSEALQYQFKALKIKENSNNKLAIANSLSNIGSIFNKLCDYKKALEYENKALDFRIEMKNKRGIAESYNDIGNIYDNMNDYDKALEYYHKSINVKRKDFDRSGTGETLENIGMLEFNAKNFDIALKNLIKSKEIKEELGEKKGIAKIYNNIAQLHYANGDYKFSSEYIDKSYDIAKKYDHKDVLQDNYELMAKIYSKTKRYKKSLDCYRKYLTIHDELMNIQKQNEIFNIYLKYDNEAKEKENEIYKLKNIQLVSANDKLQASRKELQKSNASKDKFFSILAHDLKNPFSILYTTSEILSSYYNELSKDKITEYINTVRMSSKHILILIENILEWSRSQSGIKRFDPVKFNLYEAIESCSSLIKPSVNLKKISFEIKVKKNLHIYADKNMIKTILRNLVTNAIKFSHSGGEIVISTVENKNETIISVQDNGVGIKKIDQKKLFAIDKHFVTIGTSNERGTGIGLLLCDEFVKKHNGKLWVESKIGRGSKFSFTIPKV